MVHMVRDYLFTKKASQFKLRQYPIKHYYLSTISLLNTCPKEIKNICKVITNVSSRY
jgi:hypothetical protein